MAPVAPVALGVMAAGQLYSGYQQKKIADFNAALAEREAGYQQRLAKAQESRLQRDVARTIGAQKVGYATAGVSLLSGSAMDAYRGSMEEAEIDAAIIRAGGTAAASRLKAEADASRMAGNAAMTKSVLTAGTSLLAAYKPEPASPYAWGGTEQW